MKICFVFWQTASFQDVLSDAEILALMVGCLCHDLDHRGTNNAFQAKWVTLTWSVMITISHTGDGKFHHYCFFLQDRFCSGFALWDISHTGASSLQPRSHDPTKWGQELQVFTGIWISHDIIKLFNVYLENNLAGPLMSLTDWVISQSAIAQLNATWLLRSFHMALSKCIRAQFQSEGCSPG